jgi:hypothetical protein
VICLGTKRADKADLVRRYCAEHNVGRVVVISPKRFPWDLEGDPPGEIVEYASTIQYVVFYRLLQEIDRDTLVVLNECLRTQDRNCLTYNCIRHFLHQAGHQIIFQYLPIIAEVKDLFILFDFDTKSRWKRESDTSLLCEASFMVSRAAVEFLPVEFHASEKLKARYEKTKKKLFSELGPRDPHTIPSNLLLLSGREKASLIDQSRWYVGRNRRLKLDNMETYRDGEFAHVDYAVFEPSHRHIDMADMVTLSEQHRFDYLTTDLKVEQWYLERYRKWISNIAEAYSVIQPHQECA